MLKKTLVIALIGLMVGGVAMGVISLADRSTTSGGRGQEQANEARADLSQDQKRGQLPEGRGAGAASYGGRNSEAGHEDCDCDDCTSGDEHRGQNQVSGRRGASGRSFEQGMWQSAAEQAADARGAGQGSGRYATEQATGARNSVDGQGARGGGGNPSQLNSRAEPVEQLTVDATVITVGEHVTIELEDRTELELGLGPTFYREEVGFDPEVGDELTVTGFHEDGEFKVMSILDASGTPLIFRDEYGRPGWAGRGNRAYRAS